MINLIRADFYRILKNKLALISLIIAAVIPFVLAAAFLGLREIFVSLDPETEEIIGFMLNARALIATTFSYTNNFGIVIPVFTALIIMADINGGVIRNKIILGYNRYKIFGSLFITTLVYSLAIMVIYAAMTAFWSVVLLGINEMDKEQILSMVYFYILGFVGLVFMVSIVSTIGLSTLSTPAAIIISLVICMILGLVNSTVSAFDYSEFKHIIQFVPGFVVASYSMGNIDFTTFLEGLTANIIFGGAIYLAGTLAFDHKDLK